MTDANVRLAVLKRAKPVISDSALMSTEPVTHPLIERTSRAISDWHTEYDWPLHVDQAIRSIETVAEYLNREGYRDASEFLQTTVWKEPKHRTQTQVKSKTSR